MEQARLRRSGQNKALLGVCGGLAEYFDVDPMLVRVAFVLVALANGIGIIAYIVLAVVMPAPESQAGSTGDVVRENLERMPQEAAEAGRRVGEVVRESGAPASDREAASRRRQNTLAAALIGVGAIFLLINLGGFIWWFNWATLWPLVLVAIGVGILIGRFRRG